MRADKELTGHAEALVVEDEQDKRAELDVPQDLHMHIERKILLLSLNTGCLCGCLRVVPHVVMYWLAGAGMSPDSSFILSCGYRK